MRVTRRIDMGIFPVQMAVDLESGCVGRSFQVSTYGFAVVIEQNEI